MVRLAKTYTTVQGDTWDMIAYKVYGSEGKASFLMQNNYRLLDILVFSEGTILNTPEVSWYLEDEGIPLPPWKTAGANTTSGLDPYDDYRNESS